ncbi:MAG: hypothetical protein KDJ24_01465 [Gammaproteobacteria bacterium]|nr:hypothetical protein [Gammaproteobacteria bacterium]
MTAYTRNSPAAMGFGMLLLALVVLAAGTLLLLPLRDVLASTPWTLADIAARFDDATLRDAFVNTAVVTVFACAVAGVFALVPAFALARGGRVTTPTALAFVALPLVIPAFVTGAAIQPLLGTSLGVSLPDSAGSAPLNVASVSLGTVYALHYFPLMVGAMSLALRRLDSDLTHALQSLGAAPFTVWRRLSLPAVWPGLGFAATLMALRITDDAATPALFGRDSMLAPYILRTALLEGYSSAAPAALMLTALCMLIVALGWNGITAFLHASPVIAGMPTVVHRGKTHASAIVAGCLTLTLLALPIAIIVVTLLIEHPAPTFDATHLTASPPFVALYPPLLMTLAYAAMAGIGVMILSSLLATLMRGRPTAAPRLILATLALPGIVLGLAAATHLRDDLSTAWIAPGWSLLVGIIVLKLLPLGDHLVARYVPVPAFDLRSADASLSGGRRPRRFWRTLNARAGLLTTLFLIGAAGLISETSTALIVLQDADTHIAARVFGAARDAGDWQVGSLLLVVTTVGAALLAIAAWRVRTPPPRRSAVDRLEMGEAQ